MKIGFDIRAVGKNRTGDETVTRQLMNNLLMIDKEDDFLLFTDEERANTLEKIKKKFYSEKEKFKVCSVLPSRKAFWTFWSLPNFLRKYPTDMLHVQYITPFWLPKNIKLITTIHDISFARFPEFIAKKDLILLKIFIPLSLRRADKIIAVSEFTKKEIIDVYKINENKIEVVYNGGASENFFGKISDKKITQFIEKNQLPNDFILYVGTLQPRKNVSFLLRSFVEFKQKFKANEKVAKLNLVIGGDKSGHNYDKSIDLEMTRIEKKFPQIAKQIFFSGFISDENLPLFYKAAKTVCICSKYEGFGLPAIEAMASETPVLSTDESCMKEICADAAMIYKHGESDDFVEKLFQIVNNEECVAELIQKGTERANDFSWKEAAKKTLQVYKKLE